MPQTLPKQRGPADSASSISPSIAGVPGEVSHQQVASCFPVASPGWGPPGHVQGKEHTDDAAHLS